MRDSKIQWTHHTFNPWRGCTKVSAGCARCYAEKMSHRNPGVLGVWGANGTRPGASESYWRQPLSWNRAAAKAGERRRVFCASLADVFEDRDDLVEPRARLFRLIYATRNLDWLLLTKRPENIQRLLPHGDAIGTFPNIWWGTSIEDASPVCRRRLASLLFLPPTVTRFVSYEPALGNVPWDSVLGDGPLPSWIIVGGESGPNGRVFDIEWARRTVAFGRERGVPVFVKQMGSHQFPKGWEWRSYFFDPKGGDPSEWPEDVRVREFPEPEEA